MADTIVLENIKPPEHNWLGVSLLETGESTERYCSAKIKNDLIYQIDDKVKTDNKHVFIGLAGIKDYNDFFNALKKNRDLIGGELQLSNGFKKLLENELKTEQFTWFDTGTPENYQQTNKMLSGAKEQFDFSKGAGEEFIYFVGDRVIKFFADSGIAKKRVERAKFLRGLVPEIIFHKDNFYAYKKVEGSTVYSVLDVPTTQNFLSWCKENLWKEIKLSPNQKEIFDKACKEFYYGKLTKRLEMFHKKTGIADREDEINGVAVPSLKELLEKIKWDDIYRGIPSNIHGDLQFDNVLVANGSKQTFTLIDWRQEFAGLLEYGDLYYDLAKLYGGLTISYQLIKDGMFSFESSDQKIRYDFFSKNSIAEAKGQLESFILENGYDLNKVKIMTALIFLNMSPLHAEPFDQMLYYLGKHMLHKCQNGD